ncbi:MAG: sirohydrochlorin chelatase [Longimicrobiales bacterium]
MMRVIHTLMAFVLLAAPAALNAQQPRTGADTTQAQHAAHAQAGAKAATGAHNAHAAATADVQQIPADAVIGTIVIAHGAGPAWNAQVESVAALVNTGGPVEVSYLMGPAAKDHRFQDVAARLVAQGATHIVVVPLLMSSHSGHYEQIRYLAGEVDEIGETMMHHLAMAGIERANATVPVHVARAIDDSPDVARVLAERALALTDEPAAHALFIIGHGPNSAEDYAAWMSNLRPIADSVKAITGFRDVKVGLVRDDAPAPVRAEAVKRVREIIQLQYELTGRDVVVVPALISTGSVSQEKIPADLAGLPVVYTGEALLPHPGLARWVEARVDGMRKE